jgi:hypothetical protein
VAEQLDAGDWRVPTLIVTPYDGTTAATLELEAPDGTVVVPAVASADDVPEAGSQTWTASGYELTEGEWIERWTVTGTGAGKERRVVQVAPDPADLLSERVYATTADFAKLLLKAPPVGARRGLAEASRLVDEMLLTAVYDVDDDTGLPTDAEHIAALRDATCLQLEWARESGDRFSVGAARPSSFALGRLSVQQAGGGANARQGMGPRGEWAPRAWARLQRAGLTGYGPQTRY